MATLRKPSHSNRMHPSIKELEAALSEIYKDTIAASKARAATLRSEPEQDRPLLARGEALRHEDERRVRAGVRVVLNPGDFEQRRAAFLADTTAHCETKAGKHARHASALHALLFRATELLGRMAEELNAPERLAVERERAEAVERERAEAAKVAAEAVRFAAAVEQCRQERVSAELAANRGSGVRPARVEW